MATVFAALLLEGCAADTMPDVPGADTEGSGTGGFVGSEPKTYYLEVSLNITTHGMQSRSETYDDSESEKAGDSDYVYGSDVENAIGETGHTLFFFDRNNKLQIIYPLNLENRVEMTPGEGDGDVIEVRYWTLIRDIEKENLPRSVLAVINHNAIYADMTSQFQVGTATVDDVLKYTWTSSDPSKIGRDENGLFVMTNSAYIVGNAVQVAVPVTEQMYHEIDDDNEPIPPLKVLNPDEILTIHVERMLAKVTFAIDAYGTTTNDDGSITFPEIDAVVCKDIDDDGNAHNVYGKWRATVNGWDMNAYEKVSYIFKNIGTSTPYTTWTYWHDADYFRSFWAEDVNYTTGYYPVQYREAVNEDLDYYNRNNQVATLNYISFNEMQTGKMNRILYMPENTYNYGTTEWGTGVVDIAGSHLLINARLDIQYDDGTWIEGGEDQDFYRGEFGIFYKNWKHAFWGIVRRFNNTLSSQTKMRYHLYNWDGDEELNNKTLEALTTTLPGRDNKNKNFKLCLNGEEITWDMVKNWGEDMRDKVFVKANIKDGDGKLLPWNEGMEIIDLNSDSKDKLSIYSSITVNENITPDNPGYNHLDEQNEGRYLRECTSNDIQSLMLEYLGALDHYTKGSMYYAAPVMINQTVRGTVRNNWYRYTLTGIKTPGISVDDLDQKIIPVRQETHDQTNLIFEVIDWHEFTFTAPLM